MAHFEIKCGHEGCSFEVVLPNNPSANELQEVANAIAVHSHNRGIECGRVLARNATPVREIHQGIGMSVTKLPFWKGRLLNIS